jgi:hypothetical protein
MAMRATVFTAMLLMSAIGQAQTLTTAQARAHDGETAANLLLMRRRSRARPSNRMPLTGCWLHPQVTRYFLKMLTSEFWT